MAKPNKETTNAPAVRDATTLANVGEDIRSSGIEVLQGKETLNGGATDAASIMEAVASAKSAEEALQILHSGAGLIPFADKKDLARKGTSFDVLRLVIRPMGGYSKDDDVALLIQLANGSKQVLTFEQNPGRNTFLTGLNAIVQNFGHCPNVALQRYGSDNDEEKHFYVLCPATQWSIRGEEAIEGEYVVK